MRLIFRITICCEGEITIVGKRLERWLSLQNACYNKWRPVQIPSTHKHASLLIPASGCCILIRVSLWQAGHLDWICLPGLHGMLRPLFEWVSYLVTTFWSFPSSTFFRAVFVDKFCLNLVIVVECCIFSANYDRRFCQVCSRLVQPVEHLLPRLFSLRVSPEKSGIILIGLPSFVTWCPSLAAFSSFTLFCVFSPLVIICHRDSVFWPKLWSVLYAPCTTIGISFSFWTFSSVLLLKTFYRPLSKVVSTSSASFILSWICS